MAKATKSNGRALTLTQPAQQIWLAGLGAFAVAEQEGSKLFTNLVKKGKIVEKANLSRMEKARGRVGDMVADLRELPTTTVEKIGDRVDGTTAIVLRRLGVPTHREIGALTRRVEELTKALEKQRTPNRTRAARPKKPVVTEASVDV